MTAVAIGIVTLSILTFGLMAIYPAYVRWKDEQEEKKELDKRKTALREQGGRK